MAVIREGAGIDLSFVGGELSIIVEPDVLDNYNKATVDSMIANFISIGDDAALLGSGSSASGYLLTSNGAGAASWSVPPAGGDITAGDDAALLGSGAATDGYVLTADGVGGAAWEVSAGGSGIANIMLEPGVEVKLVYRATPARWEYPDGSLPDLTGRAASITWEGTATQIPLQGTGTSDFRVGDTALVRSTSL